MKNEGEEEMGEWQREGERDGQREGLVGRGEGRRREEEKEAIREISSRLVGTVRSEYVWVEGMGIVLL